MSLARLPSERGRETTVTSCRSVPVIRILDPVTPLRALMHWVTQTASEIVGSPGAVVPPPPATTTFGSTCGSVVVVVAVLPPVCAPAAPAQRANAATEQASTARPRPRAQRSRRVSRLGEITLSPAYGVSWRARAERAALR